MFYWVSMRFSDPLLSSVSCLSVGLHCVVFGFTQFYWVILTYGGGVNLVLLGFDAFYLVFLGCQWVTTAYY